MKEAFARLKQVMTGGKISQLPYEQVYFRLKTLADRQKKLPRYLQHAYQSEENKFYQLLCCIDEDNLFFEIVLPEEWCLWAELSLFADCINIPKAFYDSQRNSIIPPMFHPYFTWHKYCEESEQLTYSFLFLSAMAGHEYFVQFLLPQLTVIDLKLYQRLIYFAAKSGNETLVMALVEKKRLKSLKLSLDQCLNPDNNGFWKITYPLYGAIESGNIDLVDRLINLGASLKSHSLDIAASSGSLEMLLFIKEKLDIPFSDSQVFRATRSPNSDMLLYLLNRVPRQITPGLLNYAQYTNNSFNVKILLIYSSISIDLAQLNEWIAPLGDLELLKEIISEFNLIPDKSTLDFGARSGNLAIVTYLISLGLKPNYYTLVCAAESGNHQLVRYLLTPPYCGGSMRPNEAASVNACLSHNTASMALINCQGIFEILLVILDENSPKRTKYLKELKEQGIVEVFTVNKVIEFFLTLMISYAPGHLILRLRDLFQHPNNYKLNKNELTEFLEKLAECIREFESNPKFRYRQPILQKLNETLIECERDLEVFQENVLPETAANWCSIL
ncbi:hypothetical protein ACFORL_01805 [Legionella dresdenensis]|uniref:Ankyrin repeats (3 copies) n=1 Tax=Legionella dresdenensis TaxID=450200 RepID=A0ABV8CCW1_9GAMM